MAENQRPHIERFNGCLGDLKDSDYFSAACLEMGKDTPYQIEKFGVGYDVKMPASGKIAKVAGFLKLVGHDKMLILNATNLNVLTALFGGTSKACEGKWIALYVDPSVRIPGGAIRPGVRIRPERIKPPVAAKGEAVGEPGSNG